MWLTIFHLLRISIIFKIKIRFNLFILWFVNSFRKIRFDENTKLSFSSKDGDSDRDSRGVKARKFLKRIAIRLNELYESFTATNNEDGLYLLNKPETNIKIIKMPNRKIDVNCSDSIETICKVDCFPIATIAYFREGVGEALQEKHTNELEFKIKSAS